MKKYSDLSPGVRASIVYTIASFITKGISYITLPIFTRLIPSTEIGIVTVYGSWMSIIGVFATLGVNTGAYNIAMHEFKDDRKTYASTALFISTIASFAVGIVYLIFFNQINKIIGLPCELIVLMIIGFFFQPATDYWMLQNRFEYKYKATTLVTVGTALLASIISLMAVFEAKRYGFLSLGSVKVFSTYAIYDLVGLAIFILIIVRAKGKIKQKYVAFALKTGFPLMIHALSKHILDASDKIMIQKMVGNSAAGIYGTLFTISSLSLIVWNAINTSLIPYLFENIEDKENGKNRINRVIIPMMLFYGAFAVVLSLLSPEIVKIVATKEYYEAIYLMPPIAAGIFFTSLYNIMGDILLFYKKTVQIMLITIFAAAFNIVTNALFIPVFGYVAASYTTLASNIVLAFGQYIAAKRICNEMPFNAKLLWIISIAITLLVVLCNFLYDNTFLRLGVVLTMIIGLFLCRKKFFDLFAQIRKS